VSRLFNTYGESFIVNPTSAHNGR